MKQYHVRIHYRGSNTKTRQVYWVSHVEAKNITEAARLAVTNLKAHPTRNVQAVEHIDVREKKHA